jgi:hypothetical protein
MDGKKYPFYHPLYVPPTRTEIKKETKKKLILKTKSK